jgi:hypothetical protein
MVRILIVVPYIRKYLVSPVRRIESFKGKIWRALDEALDALDFEMLIPGVENLCVDLRRCASCKIVHPYDVASQIDSLHVKG